MVRVPSEDSKLDRVKKNLYSRTPRPTQDSHEFSWRRDTAGEVPPEWSSPERETDRYTLAPRSPMAFSIKIFIGAVIFFLISAGVAALVFYGGSNTVSSSDVEIAISGPVSVAAGEEVALEVVVTNRNPEDLEYADLRLDFPDGTREAGKLSRELKRTGTEFGVIEPGGERRGQYRAVFFGEENSRKEITAHLEYRIVGSNAIYEKVKKLEMIISSAPVTLRVESLKEINSDQEIQFDVEVISNAKTVLKSVAVRAEYAFGFTVLETTPKPLPGTTVWSLGDMNPGSKKLLKIRGRLRGQNGEERNFRFSVGGRGVRDETKLEPVFLTLDRPISIKRPFIGLDLALDGNTRPSYSVPRGDVVRADVTWVNNLSVPVSDMEIRVDVKGLGLDKRTVQVTEGFYQSADNTIIWNKSTSKRLALAEPGQEGSVSFTFQGEKIVEGRLPTDEEEIIFEVSVQGRRVSDTEVPEQIVSEVKRTVRLATSLELSPRIVYYVGPFSNSGPLPPVAETETTYTIIWTITNSTNETRDVKVTASLPTYVRWLNVASPESEKITYSTAGGRVTWDVGGVPPGTGFGIPAREVAFQISFLPSQTQIQSTPILLGPTTVTGYDEFADIELESADGAHTTNLTTDPNFRNDQALVAQKQ